MWYKGFVEGSPRGDFCGAKAPAPYNPLINFCRNRIMTHIGRAVAGGWGRSKAVGMAGVRCPDKGRRGGGGDVIAENERRGRWEG